MVGGAPFLPCITVTHATTLAVTAEDTRDTGDRRDTGDPLLLPGKGSALTFACVVGQDGASSRLLALRVLPRAGVRAVRPAGPGTQRAVLRTRHLAHERHGQNGVPAQLPSHKLTWMDGSTFPLLEKPSRELRLRHLGVLSSPRNLGRLQTHGCGEAGEQSRKQVGGPAGVTGGSMGLKMPPKERAPLRIGAPGSLLICRFKGRSRSKVTPTSLTSS